MVTQYPLYYSIWDCERVVRGWSYRQVLVIQALQEQACVSP